jgi:putative chitinase
MSFQFNFTADKLQECLSRNQQIDTWYPLLADILPKFEINTIQRVAAFLAQCAHESMDFTTLQENLNYKAETLHRVWPRLFPDEATCNHYAHNPELIANRAYGGRMGNGPEASGDGFRYRGRGIVQITGHDNYKQCSRDLYQDDRLLEHPDWICTPEGALWSACWFWHRNNLNPLADQDDMLTMTKRINGGTLGLDERTAHYNNFCNILADDS